MSNFQSTINFIRELYNTPDGFIPLHAPVFSGNEKKYLNDCIDTTFVSSVGKYVDLFEEKVAEYTGAKKAVACVNGTNALHLALLLAGVEPKDEVITQALTFVATANAISYCGAQPIFLDVDMDTMGLSPTAVENWLMANAEINGSVCYNKTSNQRIKACVPMHTFGHPVHLDELMEVCNRWNIELVEDAAESLGSFYKGKHTGTFGKIGVLSFNGNKTITTGGGGMLLFNDEILAQRAKHLTTQAKIAHPWNFEHDAIGYNYRMPNINAAIGCAQMEYLDQILESKRKTAEAYKRFFSLAYQTTNTPAQKQITFFSEPKDCKSNFWLNTIILPDRKVQQQFLLETNNAGVMTRPIWQLMNRLPMFQDCQTDNLTNSYWFEECVVNIPSSANINKHEYE